MHHYMYKKLTSYFELFVYVHVLHVYKKFKKADVAFACCLRYEITSCTQTP